MKLANILLHFPNNPNVGKFTKAQKQQFLSKVDLKRFVFEVKISDFGLSTVFDGNQSTKSIVGTPLYQSPQVLKRRNYDDKVDTWALGCMVFELLVGTTPFHSYEMRDLVRKINDGRFRVTSDREPVKIESCLFLLDCMQAVEKYRIQINELFQHPFISEEYKDIKLHDVDNEAFLKGQGQNRVDRETASPNQISMDEGSLMMSRFDDTTVLREDIILTIKNSA